MKDSLNLQPETSQDGTRGQPVESVSPQLVDILANLASQLGAERVLRPKGPGGKKSEALRIFLQKLQKHEREISQELQGASEPREENQQTALQSALDFLNDLNDQPTTESDFLAKQRFLSQVQEGIGRLMQTFPEELSQEKLEGSLERVRDFVWFYYKVDYYKRIIQRAIDSEIKEVFAKNRQDEAFAFAEVDRMLEVLDQLNQKLWQYANTSPEAFWVYGIILLRRYKREFEKFGTIITPELEARYARIKKDARVHLDGRNGVITLLGGTGTGKTVIAKKLAQDLSPDGRFEFVSAHSEMTPDDLISRVALRADSVDPEYVPRLIREKQEAYLQAHPDISEEDKQRAFATIEEVVKRQAQENKLQTKRVLEAVGRAAEAGIPVVIDEFNFLTPETIASMNALLAKNNKDGFFVIFTGNVGEEFIKRQRLDPAFVNRILTGVMKWNVPAQESDSALESSILTQEEMMVGRERVPRDLYIAVLTQLIDRKGNLIAPEDVLEKSWNLSKAFSAIIKMANGERPDRVINDDSLVQIGKTVFKNIFLSYRNLNSVVRSWKLDGYKRPLDYYVYEQIIRPAEIINPREAAMLMYYFQYFGFFEDKVFSEVDIDATTWKVTGIDKVDLENYTQDVQMVAISVKDLVEAELGVKTPREVLRKRNDAEIIKKEGLLEELKGNLSEYKKHFQLEKEKIALVCPEEDTK